MPEETFRGQETTLTLEDDGTEIPVGILDEAEVTVEHEVSELRGAGSTKWQDLQKTATNVSVSGTLMSFAIDAWDKLVDYDTDGLDESAEVVTFTVIMTFSTSAGEEKTITAEEVYFGSVPFGGSRDEWIGLDLDGTGRDITITNPAE